MAGADPFSDRIRFRKHPARQSLIDDRNRRRPRHVAAIEVAPGAKPYSERFEKGRTGDKATRLHRRAVVTHIHGAELVAAQAGREAAGRRDGSDAGSAAQAFGQTIIEVTACFLIRLNVKDDKVVHLETYIQSLPVAHGSRQ